jgi:hypothetical protein
MNVSNSAFYMDLQALKLDPNHADRIFAEDRAYTPSRATLNILLLAGSVGAAAPRC